MELTKKEAELIIEGRVCEPIKEQWRRFKSAWRKSWRFKAWAVAKPVFLISLAMVIAMVVVMVIGRMNHEYSTEITGAHDILLDGTSLYIDGELVNKYEEMPVEILIFGYMAYVFAISGFLLLVNWIFSFKRPISITKITDIKSYKELALEHWEAKGELPPIPKRKASIK